MPAAPLGVRPLGELGVDAHLGSFAAHRRGGVHPGRGPPLDGVGHVDVVVEVWHHDVLDGPLGLDLFGQEVVHRHHRVEPETARGQTDHRHPGTEVQAEEAMGHRDGPETLGVRDELAHPQK